MDTPVVVALIAATGAVIAAFFAWRASTQATQLGWAKELREDAAGARTEVAKLREEVRDLRRQLELAQREADHWLTEHQTARRHAHRPGMTIERLRELLGPVDPPAAAANGR